MPSPTTARLLRPLLLLGLAVCAAGCESTGGTGDKEYKQGLEQADAGDTEQALKTLQAGARKYPDHLRMRFALARLQYEAGEGHHLQERQALRAAAASHEQNRRQEAMASRREADKHRAKARPFYEAARTNLRHVVAREEDDLRIAWAYFLLMRVDLFFEDYESAYENLERAIELGKPTGPKLATWREFQTGIRSRLGGSVKR